jgi:hypothetical protein
MQPPDDEDQVIEITEDFRDLIFPANEPAPPRPESPGPNREPAENGWPRRIFATRFKLAAPDFSVDADEDFTRLPILGTPRRIPPLRR